MVEDWISIKDASERSGYNAEYIRDMVRKGKLKARKFADVWQVSRQALDDLVQAAKTSKDKRRGPYKPT